MQISYSRQSIIGYNVLRLCDPMHTYILHIHLYCALTVREECYSQCVCIANHVDCL